MDLDLDLDLDTDLHIHGSTFIWVFGIRICIGNADPDPGASKLTKHGILPFKKTFVPSYVCLFDLFPTVSMPM